MSNNRSILYDIKPCINSKNSGLGCRIQVIRTEAGSYKVGCVNHSVWQQRAYTTVPEAIERWSKTQGG